MDQDEKLVADVCSVLGDTFDTVQVFASRHKDDQTVGVVWGIGNNYARYGQVQRWLIDEDNNSPETPDE